MILVLTLQSYHAVAERHSGASREPPSGVNVAGGPIDPCSSVGRGGRSVATGAASHAPRREKYGPTRVHEFVIKGGTRRPNGGPPNVPALTCGRNGSGGDDDVDAPTRAAGAKRTRREGLLVANAPVRFSGQLDAACKYVETDICSGGVAAGQASAVA
jgi:hypothetical protein